TVVLQVNGRDLNCLNEWSDRADVEAHISEEAMNEILAGRMTFQRAFMGGEMKMKGDFKILRTLDDLFVFM
ncbi:MAG: SCP2 sterol-binding domain-containing protein, partial [Eubacterium sp.]|nr:SCP2 sterol-binding domain-containing protein [Eubacterium sp.]